MAGYDWIEADNYRTGPIKRASAVKRPAGNPGHRRKRPIKNLLCAFDIETSPVPGREESALYHWQMVIGDDLIHGRTWEELDRLLNRLVTALGSSRLVIYVHNLSYEFQFLRTIYHFNKDEVFALSSRKVAKCTMFDGHIEFRCSFILSNMSLAQWTRRMGAEHAKLSADDYDHERVRFPWTLLTDEELAYCANDVLGLVEALRIQMDRDGDTLETIPLTATGYVRRDVRKVMAGWSRLALEAMQPSVDVYIALREAFRGGDTHTNRLMAGHILTGVGSVDRSSSYPDVLVNCEFPGSRWTHRPGATMETFEEMRRLHMAVLLRLRFYGLRLADRLEGDPILSYSKCRRVIEPVLDNGRVCQAVSMETTITDVDWLTISEVYTWDRVEVIDLWSTCYSFLPQCLTQLIIRYYRDKTKLKGVPGMELYYNKSKALLNSIFGLAAYDACKVDVIFTDNAPDPDTGDAREAFIHGPEDLESKLAKHRKKAFLSYAWGVWCTALARRRLFEGIKLCRQADGRNNFVYCDTDSIKYIGNIDLTAYNAARIKDSQFNGAWADDPQGQRHYMGVFEDEGRADRFIALGAKKYAYEKNGKLVVTVSGVGKRKGPVELEAAGGLEAFRTGMVWTDAAGLDPVYNDLTKEEIEMDGHRLRLGPNVYLRKSSYTLMRSSGPFETDAELLEDLKSREIWNEILHNAGSHAGSHAGK